MKLKLEYTKIVINARIIRLMKMYFIVSDLNLLIYRIYHGNGGF